MCNTCPCNSVSSIPGPGDVASALLRVPADSVAFKISRKVVFFGIAVPLTPVAVVSIFGWWTIALVALAAALSAAGLAYARVLHRSAVIARPEPTPQMRAQLAARGLRTIPAPGQARPALPRAMVRSLGRGRQALPAPPRALPAAVVTGNVVPAPVRGKMRP